MQRFLFPLWIYRTNVLMVKLKKMIPVPVGAGTRIGGHIYNTTSSYRIIS